MSEEIAIFFLLMNSTKIKLKFTFSTSYFRIRNQLSLIIMDHYSISAFNKAEILVALKNERNWIFQIEDMRSIPVRNIVYVAVISCSCYQIIVAYWHIDNSVFEV